jgi:histidinol-phosphate/aromatic aminotransferase/cobyric acid decarboxylase-like protein
MGLRFLDRIADYRALLPELHFQRRQKAEALLDTNLFQEDSLCEGPSFITLAVQEPYSALSLAQQLLEQRILIRVCDNIPGMPPNYVRFQVRPLDSCEELLHSLKKFARR